MGLDRTARRCRVSEPLIGCLPVPCTTCPYRRDVPSGIWAPEEYQKLLAYDRPTMQQPAALFMCHQGAGGLCTGWVQCHAKAGDPCIDPKSDATPRPHKTRGPGQYERHLQQEIDRKTAREKAKYGPLFQELAEAEVHVPTVEELKWQKRFEHARGAENRGCHDMAACSRRR